MTWLPRKAEHGAERGAVAVEFALVLPLLVMIVFGIIEFGMVMSQKAALASGARTGARYGSVNLYAGDRTCGKVIEETRSKVTTVGMGATDVGVTVKRGATTVCSAASGSATPSGGDAPCTNASFAAGSETLYVEATFDTELYIPLTGIDSDITLESTGAYRCEYH